MTDPKREAAWAKMTEEHLKAAMVDAVRDGVPIERAVLTAFIVSAGAVAALCRENRDGEEIRNVRDFLTQMLDQLADASESGLAGNYGKGSKGIEGDE